MRADRKIAIVAVVRNEQRYIQEWIAYHSVLGFDSIVLFDNNSTDETIERAHALRHLIDVRIHQWPARDETWQTGAYLTATRTYATEFEWMAVFDTDEFLTLPADVDLRTALSVRPDASAIAIPWAMFGSSGHRERPNGLVIEKYLYRSAPDFGPNRHMKSIVRPERVISVQNPHECTIDGFYCDLSGREFRSSPSGLFAEAPDFSFGKLNHYFTRSWEDWVEKVNRGYNVMRRPLSEFDSYDINDVFDNSAQKFAGSVRELLDRI